MNVLELSFDAVLAITIVLIAWRALATSDLVRAVILFISSGLLMALAWARLAAPDLALAEVAIGAGLTGVLLLQAARTVSGRRHDKKVPPT